eukprot:4953813-Amphidinium_carterae.1
MDTLPPALQAIALRLQIEDLSDIAGFSLREWTDELGESSLADASAALALHSDARKRFERELKRRRLSTP